MSLGILKLSLIVKGSYIKWSEKTFIHCHRVTLACRKNKIQFFFFYVLLSCQKQINRHVGLKYKETEVWSIWWGYGSTNNKLYKECRELGMGVDVNACPAYVQEFVIMDGTHKRALYFLQTCNHCNACWEICFDGLYNGGTITALIQKSAYCQ